MLKKLFDCTWKNLLLTISRYNDSISCITPGSINWEIVYSNIILLSPCYHSVKPEFTVNSLCLKFHENRTLFLMRQGSYQDFFMFFCNFILLQSSYVFERLERHTAFLSRRYFERRERSINQVFDASILDCNHMLSSRQIFLRPNPPQF